MGPPSTDRSADVAALLDDWEHMSEHFLPGRALLLTEAVDWLRHMSPQPKLLELGSGPGTTLRTLGRALPRAQLAGVDNDPVLRHLHNIATPRSASISVIDCDLSDSSWIQAAPVQSRQDVVVAVQILHYFSPPRFGELLSEIRQLLEPGGVLVHLDNVPSAASQPSPNQIISETDPWARWWDDAAAIPLLADAFRQRSGPAIGSAEYHPSQQALDAHLRSAGFDRVALRRRHGTSLLTISCTPT